MRLVLRALALAFGIAATASAQNAVPMQTKPLDPANIDRSVSACTDFYQFANGGWVQSHPVPPAYSTWGSFAELSENNQSNLLTILRAPHHPSWKRYHCCSRASFRVCCSPVLVTFKTC